MKICISRKSTGETGSDMIRHCLNYVKAGLFRSNPAMITEPAPEGKVSSGEQFLPVKWQSHSRKIVKIGMTLVIISTIALLAGYLMRRLASLD